MDNLSVRQSAVAATVRARGNEDHLQPRGRFVVEHFRKGLKIGQYEFSNSVVNEGKNKLFNVMFNSATADYGVVHRADRRLGDPDPGGRRHLCPDRRHQRLERVRGLHGDHAAGMGQRHVHQPSRSPTPAPAVFDINGSGSVYGLFLVGGGSAPSTKNDHSGGGTLWAEAQFASGTVTVANGDQLKVTYTVSC